MEPASSHLSPPTTIPTQGHYTRTEGEHSESSGPGSPPRAEIRSDDVDEILSTVPSALVRWGIGVISVVLSLLLAFSALVRYPDTVTTQVSLTADVPPLRLVPERGGEIRELYVEDDEPVEEGDALIELVSTADPGDVRVLRRWIATVDAKGGADRLLESGELVPAKELDLGGLQDRYSALLRALSEWENMSASGKATQRRIGSLRQQVQGQHRLLNALRLQQSHLDKEVEIAEEALERSRALHASGTIPLVRLQEAEAALLRAASAAESGRTNLISNDLRLVDIEQEIADLTFNQNELRQRRRVAVITTVRELKSALEEWEKEHVLTAPTDGRASFFRPLRKGFHVSPEEPVLMVVPPSERIMAQAYLPQAGVGKVASGQRVLVEIDGYPAGEFGRIEGRVTAVSDIAQRFDQGSAYYASITFPEGFQSHYGRSFTFREGLTGTAEIITEDVSVMERIFSSLYHALDTAVGK